MVMSIDDLLDEFLTYHVKMELYRPNTAAAIRSDVRGLLRFLARQGIPANVNALTGRIIAQYLASEKSRVKATTLKRWVKSFNALGRWATDQGIIARNPAAGIKVGRVSPERREFLFSTEDAARFLTVSARTGLLPEVDSALRHLALFGGLRRSELLSLKWSHIDLQTNELRIYNSKYTAACVFRPSRPPVPVQTDH